MRFFNTAGPIVPEQHYFIPARLNQENTYQLIRERKYFILHAPRQSGKTSAILNLVKQINSEGAYHALYVNVEPAQAMRSKVKEGMRVILDQFRLAVERDFAGDPGLSYFDKPLEDTGNELSSFLQYWCHRSDKPILLFLDEIDSLVGDTLISVLRQLRAGYPNRPKNFPQSLCLIGVRDVRDYRIWSDREQGSILGGSAFNIKSESLVLANFTLEEVRALYGQHTAETGQKFSEEAIAYAFEQTQGQPWLVNALAYQACFRDVKDRTQPISLAVMERSREALILRRDTHLDVLIDRLEEPRVQKIISTILIGEEARNFPQDDLSYVMDLGLIRIDHKKNLVIANPIYQEVIPRELTHMTQATMLQETMWYLKVDGSLDMKKLLAAFTQFYRENSEIWLEQAAYKEAGPHLLLMAFLQRVINGGGKLYREYALGRKRVDLLVVFKMQRIVIELKIKRGDKTLQEGLAQTVDYMDKSKATEGHLVIFDRSKDLDWESKIFNRTETFENHQIEVWGL